MKKSVLGGLAMSTMQAVENSIPKNTYPEKFSYSSSLIPDYKLIYSSEDDTEVRASIDIRVESDDRFFYWITPSVKSVKYKGELKSLTEPEREQLEDAIERAVYKHWLGKELNKA